MAWSQNPLIEELFQTIGKFCAPIFVCPEIDTPPNSIDDNGTCGFFDTGTRKILITADHVVQKFEEIKAKHGKAYLAINVGPGNTIILSELGLLDRDRTYLDLAVLNFPDLLFCGEPCHKTYFRIKMFPPPIPSNGNALSLIGFPGCLRKGLQNAGSFSPVEVGYTISSVSDRQIVLADEHGDRRVIGDQFKSTDQIPLGGFSGSPGYVLDQDGLLLAGFLRAGSKGVDESPIHLPGVIFLSPAHYLTQDGTFDRIRMPWGLGG